MWREHEVRAAVARYVEVLNGADPEILRDVLADDIEDDPLAQGAPGIDGVIERVRLYRAVLPDASTELLSVVPDGDVAAVVWVTAATGLDGSLERVRYRYRAEIAMRGARIRSHRILSIEPVGRG